MQKIFEEAMDYIAGSCMISPTQALETIMGKSPTEEEAALFDEFLVDNECYECEVCGWWTHPGEGNLCSSCCDELEDEDD